MTGTQRRIEMFGGLRLRRHGKAASPLGVSKTGALLTYLSFYRSREHNRQNLAERFWSAMDINVSRANLRQALTDST